MNATCQSTNRFYIKYRCLPVIQNENHYQCDSTVRRNIINLSCENSFRLYIKMALVGISTQQSSALCDKNTYWVCNHYVPDSYRNVCNNRLSYAGGSQCDIHYNDRPRLKACPHGELSNFSMIEYLCIPGEGITADLPRIDICANDDIEYLSINRGLLHSPHYPYSLGTYLSCKKRLQISHESHIRFFMLEKSIEYSHQMNIRLLTTEPNIQRTLNKNEYFETNLTKETIEFELKTNHVGEGKFLLYFQVDSRISEDAPMTLESERQHDEISRRKNTSIKREWGIVFGCLIGLVLVLLLIALVIFLVRIFKRRRARSLRYMKANDQHLNEHQHQSKRGIQIEHPHLLSSTTILGPTHRTTINNDNRSDCESLLKQTNQNTDMNTYLQPKTFNEKNNSTQPIRDHNENAPRYRRPAPLAKPEANSSRLESIHCDAPMASTETLDVGGHNEQNKRPAQAPPRVPPPRMDLPHHARPSAPPLHLLQQDFHHTRHNPNV